VVISQNNSCSKQDKLKPFSASWKFSRSLLKPYLPCMKCNKSQERNISWVILQCHHFNFTALQLHFTQYPQHHVSGPGLPSAAIPRICYLQVPPSPGRRDTALVTPHGGNQCIRGLSASRRTQTLLLTSASQPANQASRTAAEKFPFSLDVALRWRLKDVDTRGTGYAGACVVFLHSLPFPSHLRGYSTPRNAVTGRSKSRPWIFLSLGAWGKR